MRRWSFSTFCRRVRGQLLVVLLCTIAFLVGGWLLRRLIYEAAVSEEKGGGKKTWFFVYFATSLVCPFMKRGLEKGHNFCAKGSLLAHFVSLRTKRLLWGCLRPTAGGRRGRGVFSWAFVVYQLSKLSFRSYLEKDEKRPSSPPSGNENGPFSFRRNFQIQLLLPPLDSVQHPSIY